MITNERGQKYLKKAWRWRLSEWSTHLERTMCNRDKLKYQIFIFKDTPELIKDLLEITKKESDDHEKRNS